VIPSDRPLETPKRVLPREKGHKYRVEHRAGRFYLLTNFRAKNFRLNSAPVDAPGKENWLELVAHDPQVLLEDMEVFQGFLVVAKKSEALVRLGIDDFATRKWSEPWFADVIYDAGLGSTPEFHSEQVRCHYESMVTAPSVYDIDMKTSAMTLRKQIEVPRYDPAQYVTERQWATARDGVKIPLSIVYKKGARTTGPAPVYLHGYGSYGLGMSADFDSDRLVLLDRGVVYVIAHIRGGNELGETWHDFGMLMKKKNTFFDFVDSAQWLIENKWTTRDQLVIEGASAGGLLIGAAVNLRPDLFKAAHLKVPFVDVMNSMLDESLPLTVGEYLEWGDPNQKEAFDCMRSYSPYDNLTKGVYPSILVTTGLNDSQVMYWEPTKYVAKLRTLKTDRNPLLLKCNMGAGHGGASGRYDALKETAFEYAWMLSQLGIEK
jgi:oligopeptidase B